jgi:hypothetical protein
VSDRDRAVAKAKTHLNVALMWLDEAARHAREAGLARQAGTLERLAREAAEVLARLQFTRQPTLPVNQGAGEEGAAAS